MCIADLIPMRYELQEIYYFVTPLIRKQQDVRLVVQMGHIGTITDICFNATGELISAALVDNNKAIWNVGKGEMAKKIM
ncbi:hypothetical protein DNU06_13385 [Putridiphycobacter roseus]|uniref:Uncharacterized protein n=1 Tax=Putridiphycobacter roseus TaxID=2219161 RepID=A0A2W1N069_9FLAO|nr:hypothetical protein [Putridiphycobacter roseus]PZE16301.1 hypothetical protein DNU06_13385 [Putridiphycobacter roseus]